MEESAIEMGSELATDVRFLALHITHDKYCFTSRPIFDVPAQALAHRYFIHHLSDASPLLFQQRPKLHDEAERDRKRGDGDFRHRRIAEPSLRIHFPKDPLDEEESTAFAGVDGGGINCANNIGKGQRLGEGMGVDEADAGETDPDGDGVGGADAWSLVVKEVRMALMAR